MWNNNEDEHMEESNESYSRDEECGKANIKDWLKPTDSLLNKLVDIKPTVYNFTLNDARTLKATNKNKKQNKQHGGQLTADNSLLANKTAWGSASSIPDLLLRQTNSQIRPESAKISRVIPPCGGKRPRPHSANPSLRIPQKNQAEKQTTFSIFGSQCASRDRPPTGHCHGNGAVGWVTSGITQDKYEKTRYEVISPYSAPHSSCNVSIEEGVSTESCGSEVELSPSIIKPIHLSLPSTEEDYYDESECVSTVRLLEQANIITEKAKSIRECEPWGKDLSPMVNISDDESLICGDFLPTNVMGNSSFRSDNLTDCIKGVNSKPKPRVHFEEKNNLTIGITPRVQDHGHCIGVDFNSNNNNTYVTPSQISRLIHSRQHSQHLSVGGKVQSGNDPKQLSGKVKSGNDPKQLSGKVKSRNDPNQISDCVDVRPLTPVSLITLNYGIDACDINTGDLNKSVTEVESAMSMLSVVRDSHIESESNKIQTKTISNPEKNYYEILRSEKDDSELVKDNIMMTTQTFQLTDGQPEVTRTESVLLSAPNKNTVRGELPKTSPGVARKPSNVPRLHLDSLTNTSSSLRKEIKSSTKIENREDTDQTQTNLKYPPRPAFRQPVLLRRPRVKSAPVSQTLRGSFHLTSENTAQRKRPSHSVLDDLDLNEENTERSEVTVQEPEEISNEVNGVQSENIFHKADIRTPITMETTHISPETAPVTMETTPISLGTAPSHTTTNNQCWQNLLNKSGTKPTDVKKVFKHSSSLINGHYSSYSRSFSAPVKRTVSKPVKKTSVNPASRLVTKQFDRDQVDVETDGIVECRRLQEKLHQRGVHVDLHTLKRALLPPDGSTYYYESTAGLPTSQSQGLLSHPRSWLPEEHKKLQQAKRRLARANRQLTLQKQQEDKPGSNKQSENPTVKKPKRSKAGKKTVRCKSVT